MLLSRKNVYSKLERMSNIIEKVPLFECYLLTFYEFVLCEQNWVLQSVSVTLPPSLWWGSEQRVFMVSGILIQKMKADMLNFHMGANFECYISKEWVKFECYIPKYSKIGNGDLRCRRWGTYYDLEPFNFPFKCFFLKWANFECYICLRNRNTRKV